MRTGRPRTSMRTRKKYQPGISERLVGKNAQMQAPILSREAYFMVR